jgi:hypothetical protein
MKKLFIIKLWGFLLKEKTSGNDLNEKVKGQ